MHTQDFVRLVLYGTGLTLAACGAEEQRYDQRHRDSADAAAERGDSPDSRGKKPRLAAHENDQVLSTLVIPFGKNGFSLTDAQQGVVHWVVDMEDTEHVQAGVAPSKYLRVKGDLKVPLDAENRPYDVGCIYVEMKDNVYYRERTWLRLATKAGINGKTFTEVRLPLAVDYGGWKDVPALDQSITLQEFEGNKIKRFDGTLCFRLDFTEAPAQEYEGDLIVQYLRPGDGPNPPACDDKEVLPECQPQGSTPEPTDDTPSEPMPPAPAPGPAATPLACLSAPAVLKAGQSATLAWSGDTGSGLSFVLSADDPAYKGELGMVVAKGDSSAIYTAPARVPTASRIIVTARPMGLETLPAFCEVTLIPDAEICAKDDGEIKGLTGNVFRIPVNTAKLPDLDQMTPVAAVVAPNLDIPERSFSAGFPGVKDLFEWFAVRFKGQLVIPENQSCTFKLTSDDGAILRIDGNVVVDNDGTHPTKSVTGTALNLTKGTHPIRIDYYQGPRYHITLQLWWKCGSAPAFTIVPPDSFERPLQ